ncbi:MAG: hypothetical protein Q6373_011310, partial [Candidatus Sigynarchaeota archaeon]
LKKKRFKEVRLVWHPDEIESAADVLHHDLDVLWRWLDSRDVFLNKLRSDRVGFVGNSDCKDEGLWSNDGRD